jgi:excisionase family DNA binding protein
VFCLSSGLIGRVERKRGMRIATKLKPNYNGGKPMSNDSLAVSQNPKPAFHQEDPLKVKEAAKFLGVSPQTVYLWVERKQIPHLRVMGRNIRFLKSDLEPFRASFKQEMENG